MIPKPLSSNAELFEYLRHLVDVLRRSGQRQLADAVLASSRFASGSPSEFLHEARIALESVSSSRTNGLPSEELEMLSSVIGQLDAAFRQIGGA